MSEEKAKRFVIAMIEAGSNVSAIGHSGYVIAEPVDVQDEAAYERIEAVSHRFADRDAYKDAIIAFLHEIGRVA